MAENTEGKKGSAGSSGIRLFAARQALAQDVQGGSGGSVLGDHQSLAGHPGLCLSVAFPISGGWATCPCARHGSGSCAGAGFSLRSPGCPAGTLELVPSQNSGSSSASAFWSGGGAPFPRSLSGCPGLSCGICPGFGSSSCAGVWRNQSLPTGVSRSSLRGCHVGTSECVCHQHSSSSSASALRSGRGSLSGCPGLSRRTCPVACPGSRNAPCPCSTCGGPATIPAGSTTCGTCAGTDFPARRPGRPTQTLELVPLRVCPPKPFSPATTSSSGSRCLGCAETASGHGEAASWISFASPPGACRVRSVRSSSVAAARSGRATSACCRTPGPAPRGTGPRAGGRGGGWAAGTAGTRPRPGSSPTGTAGRSSAGTSWSTRC